MFLCRLWVLSWQFSPFAIGSQSLEFLKRQDTSGHNDPLSRTQEAPDFSHRGMFVSQNLVLLQKERVRISIRIKWESSTFCVPCKSVFYPMAVSSLWNSNSFGPGYLQDDRVSESARFRGSNHHDGATRQRVALFLPGTGAHDSCPGVTGGFIKGILTPRWRFLTSELTPQTCKIARVYAVLAF